MKLIEKLYPLFCAILNGFYILDYQFVSLVSHALSASDAAKWVGVLMVKLFWDYQMDAIRNALSMKEIVSH